jgi:hypothetical protein
VEVVENNQGPEPADDGAPHDTRPAQGGAPDGEGPDSPDSPDGPDGPDEGKDPLRFSNWMKRSATGAVMTGIAVGLQEALQPRNREAPFVIEATEPDDPDGPIDLRFDPDSPADTVAFIRRPAADPPGES